MRKLLFFSLIFVLLSVPVFATVYDDHLIEYWSFNSSTEYDGVILGTPGSLAGDATNTTSGKIGGGWKFDGTGDWIDYPNSAPFNISGTTPFSVSAWAYPIATPDSWGAIIGTQDAGLPAKGGWAIAFTTVGADSLAMTTINNQTDQYFLRAYPASGNSTPPTYNAWAHIVMTYSGCSGGSGTSWNDDGCGKTYFNGVRLTDAQLTESASSNGFAGLTSKLNLRIGADLGAREFKGRLDEIGIYNTNLTDAEIAEIYNSGAGSQPPPYVAPLEINNNTFNLTSDGGCISWRTDQTDPCTTMDSTPTITFTTSLAANCSLRNITHSYDSDYICSTTGNITQICTIYNADKMVLGLNDIFVSCNAGSKDVNSTGLAVNYTGQLWSITVVETPINYSDLNSPNFSEDYLKNIEYAEFNFTFNDTINLNNWYFNFTANGARACSIGNKQDSLCYNYDNSSYKWIQFINGSITGTFDSINIESDESIDPIMVNDSFISLKIAEYFAPNMFEWYSARYNFSDPLWLTSTNYRITGNKMLLFKLNYTNIPVNADFYKVNIRMKNSSTPPIANLVMYLCNITYSTGNPAINPNCASVAEQDYTEFKDGGTMFRTTWGKSVMDVLGNIAYMVFFTSEASPTKYYYTKMYGITNASYTEKWYYSINNGATWTRGSNNYESDFNINWYYDGGEPTAFMYRLYTESDEGVTNVFEDNITWNIDPDHNYRPYGSIINPAPLSTAYVPYNITFFAQDYNNDYLNVTLRLYGDGGSIYNISPMLDENDTYFYFTNTSITGLYDLKMDICELNTTEKYCHTDTSLQVMFLESEIFMDSLSCFYNNEPYQFIQGFNVLCYTSTPDIACYGALYHDDKIVQLVPDQKITDSGTVYSMIESDSGAVVIPFSGVGVKSNITINLTVTCLNGSDEWTFSRIITPQTRKYYDVNDVLVWGVDNAAFIVGSILLLIILIWMARWILNK